MTHLNINVQNNSYQNYSTKNKLAKNNFMKKNNFTNPKTQLSQTDSFALQNPSFKARPDNAIDLLQGAVNIVERYEGIPGLLLAQPIRIIHNTIPEVLGVDENGKKLVKYLNMLGADENDKIPLNTDFSNIKFENFNGVYVKNLDTDPDPKFAINFQYLDFPRIFEFKNKDGEVYKVDTFDIYNGEFYGAAGENTTIENIKLAPSSTFTIKDIDNMGNNPITFSVKAADNQEFNGIKIDNTENVNVETLKRYGENTTIFKAMDNEEFSGIKIDNDRLVKIVENNDGTKTTRFKAMDNEEFSGIKIDNNRLVEIVENNDGMTQITFYPKKKQKFFFERIDHQTPVCIQRFDNGWNRLFYTSLDDGNIKEENLNLYEIAL